MGFAGCSRSEPISYNPTDLSHRRRCAGSRGHRQSAQVLRQLREEIRATLTPAAARMAMASGMQRQSKRSRAKGTQATAVGFSYRCSAIIANLRGLSTVSAIHSYSNHARCGDIHTPRLPTCSSRWQRESPWHALNRCIALQKWSQPIGLWAARKRQYNDAL